MRLGFIFTYRIYVRNLGRTEAHDIRLRFAPGTFGSRANAAQRGVETFWQDKFLLGKVAGAPAARMSNPTPTDLAPGETTTVPAIWNGSAPTSGGMWVDYPIGRIDYTDAFGIEHWHSFCFFVADDQWALSNCKYGNNNDQNPELPPN